MSGKRPANSPSTKSSRWPVTWACWAFPSRRNSAAWAWTTATRSSPPKSSAPSAAAASRCRSACRPTCAPRPWLPSAPINCATKTHAKKDGDDYVINGSKMWITNSPSADFMCLLANTSDDKPHVNKSLIVVPMNTPGISVSPHLDKLGMRSSETAQVFLDNVRVPQRNRIGHEGAGFMMQMLQFQEERLFGAANMIKGLEHCVDATIEYCKERQTFGQPLINNQVIHFRMAELQTEIECLRALVYQATEQYVRGRDVTNLASMAKLKAGRLGREVSDSCLQYWGGMGYMWENPVARAYRDVRLVSIGGGADEIMLGIICKLMGILPGKKKG